MSLKSRESHLRRAYGLSIEQYNDLLEKQDHCCAVCLRPETQFKTRLCVDHNHQTGEIRGLLCIHCNRYRVGRSKAPDAPIHRRIADYLEQGTGWYVPTRKVRRTRKNASRVRKKSKGLRSRTKKGRNLRTPKVSHRDG